MELRKLKYLSAMLNDKLLAVVCLAVNPGASFIFLGAELLHTQEWE